MKLYAKITSERGKVMGKGGNAYICIALTVQNGTKKDYPIGEIILDYKDDNKEFGSTQNEWILKFLPFTKYDADIIAQGNVEA